MPFYYLVDYAHNIGINPQQGAFLLSIIGITNTFGRIVCGFICDKPWVDALKIYNWSLIIGGLATMGSAWLTSFAMLACYAALFGLCVGEY